MVAGREGNKLVYVAQLFLKPDCSLLTTDPVCLWFSDLLTSLGDKFNTLTCTTYNLPNWAAHAEVMQYHCINEECHKIEEQLAKLRARLSINNEALDTCRFQIEASSIPHQLWNL